MTAPSSPASPGAPGRRRRIVLGIIGCLGASLVLAAVAFWGIMAAGKRLNHPGSRPQEATVRLPSPAKQQQALEAARQGVTAWVRKDYPTVYGSLSRRTAARAEHSAAQYAREAAQQRGQRFFEEDLGRPGGFAVLEGARLEAVRARLHEAAGKTVRPAIEKREWPRWHEAQLVPVEYELGGFAWAAIMVKEDGAWRAFVTPGECSRDELRPAPVGRPDDSTDGEASSG